MKTIRRALFWSVGMEGFALVLVLGGHLGLSFLPYLGLAFHFPALYLVDYWPAARQTLVGPVLIQWFVWFIAFAAFFGLRHTLKRYKSAHENRSS